MDVGYDALEFTETGLVATWSVPTGAVMGGSGFSFVGDRGDLMLATGDGKARKLCKREWMDALGKDGSPVLVSPLGVFVSGFANNPDDDVPFLVDDHGHPKPMTYRQLGSRRCAATKDGAWFLGSRSGSWYCVLAGKGRWVSIRIPPVDVHSTSVIANDHLACILRDRGEGPTQVDVVELINGVLQTRRIQSPWHIWDRPEVALFCDQLYISEMGTSKVHILNLARGNKPSFAN
jgi:hypothetical protein